jgi:chemotaxis methyl-accepting protein methylase
VPQAEVVRDIVAGERYGSDVKIASIGCSTGAELYSFLYVLRSSLPKTRISGLGIDVSHGVIEVARRAVYDTSKPSSSGLGLFHPGGPEADMLSDDTVAEMFETLPDGHLRVRDWIRADTSWLSADATNPNLTALVGIQDVILANNFLGPMDDDHAESCVRNLLKLLRPGGIFVAEGTDQDLRARLFPELGLEPQLDRLEDVYNADVGKHNWPWDRWAHEPIDRKRADWPARYSSIFKKL